MTTKLLSISRINILSVFLIGSQILHGFAQKDEEASSQKSIGSSPVTVKFVEFLDFDKLNHEAEFLLQILTSAVADGQDKDPEDYLKKLFINQRSLDILLDGKDYQFSPNGNVTIGRKIKAKVTIGCQMHYILYPYDMHLCSVTLMGPVTPKFCGDDLKSYEFHVKGYLSMPLVPPVKPGTKVILADKPPEMPKVPKPQIQLVHLIIERTSGQQIFAQMYSPVLMLAMLSFLTMLSALSHTIRIATSLSMLLCSILVTAIFWMDIPRAGKGDVTVLEHYFAICVGFIFQTFFSNILMYWYSALYTKYKSKTVENGGDLEANGMRNGESISTSPSIASSDGSLADKTASSYELTKKKKKSCAENEEEEFILTLGKFHKFLYFKCLKPGKKQLPIAFLIIMLIYWILVLYLSSGLPKGFQYLPKSANPEIPSSLLCL